MVNIYIMLFMPMCEVRLLLPFDQTCILNASLLSFSILLYLGSPSLTPIPLPSRI